MGVSRYNGRLYTQNDHNSLISWLHAGAKPPHLAQDTVESDADRLRGSSG
jgi:hypothetical protein